MNKSTQMGFVSSTSDLIDAQLERHQLCGSKQCPGCGHKLEGKPDWVGLPAGVKFDPTDQELIEHLDAKVEGKESKSHPLIDEFISTIEGEDGICYTHPEKLPGVTRDGLSRHFFHRPSKAYTTGTRKRRKIQMMECDLQLQGGETRWHKTGKTRPVMVNGNHKGCKKILVLYTNFGKNRKPEKTNWVMHQYHLGQHEEEKEGELVVSKIFYQTQPRQCNWSERTSINSSTAAAAQGSNYDPKSRIESGGGSCSNSMEIIIPQRDDQFSAAAANVGPPLSSYSAIDIQQLKAHHYSFLPFRKTFDEAGNIGEASIAREAQAAAGTCEVRDMAQHHVTHERDIPQHHVTHEPQHQHQASAAFHVSRPSHSISTIISPPAAPLHQASIFLDENHSFHLPRIMLPNQNFQTLHNHQVDDYVVVFVENEYCIIFRQQQQQHPPPQQHHKLGLRSASGLEELIMGCTSTNTKEEPSIANPQEAEWLKYSTFWPDTDNPDHHG